MSFERSLIYAGVFVMSLLLFRSGNAGAADACCLPSVCCNCVGGGCECHKDSCECHKNCCIHREPVRRVLHYLAHPFRFHR